MTKNMKGLIGFPFLAVLVASIANAQTPLNERDMAMTMSGEFTFASVGDLMMRRPASQLSDPEIQAVFAEVFKVVGTVSITQPEPFLTRHPSSDLVARFAATTSPESFHSSAAGFAAVPLRIPQCAAG